MGLTHHSLHQGSVTRTPWSTGSAYYFVPEDSPEDVSGMGYPKGLGESASCCYHETHEAVKLCTEKAYLALGSIGSCSRDDGSSTLCPWRRQDIGMRTCAGANRLQPESGTGREERRPEVCNHLGSLFPVNSIFSQQCHPQNLTLTRGPLRDTHQTTGTSSICGVHLHSQSAAACLFLMVASRGMSNNVFFKV